MKIDWVERTLSYLLREMNTIFQGKAVSQYLFTAATNNIETKTETLCTEPGKNVKIVAQWKLFAINFNEFFT